MQGFRKLSFDRLIWWGLVAAILFAPLAVGTLHTPTRAILFLITGSLGLFLAGSFCQSGARVYIDGFVFWLMLVGGVLLFQVVPLDPETLASWSPLAATIHGDMAEMVGGEAVTWISLDRAETLLSFGHLVAYLVFYLVAFNYSLRESNARRIAGVVASLGLIGAGVGLLHLLSGSDKILWFYSPELTTKLQPFTTFLVNPNHAAALFNLSALVFLGMGRDASAARPRLIFSLLFTLAAAGTLATFSRGGISALGVAMALYFVGGSLSPATGEETTGFTSGAFVLGSFLLLATAGVFLVGVDVLEGLMRDYGVKMPTLGEVKFSSWADALALAHDYRGVGIGRGAFGSVFTAYNNQNPALVFHFVENEALQAAVDFGVTLAVPMLFLLVLLIFRRVIWGMGQALGIGLACGIFAVGVQNLVDFNLEVPGVAIPTLAILAALSGGWRHKQRRKVLAHLRVGALRWLLVAVPLFVVPLAVNHWHAYHGVGTARSVVRAAAAHPDLSVDERIRVEAFLEGSLQEHPADAELAFLGAAFHQRWGSPNRAEVLLAHAGRRAPLSSGVHLARALLLKQQGDLPKAAGELRWVLERFPLQTEKIYHLFLSWRIPFPVLAETLGEDGDLDVLLGYGDWLLSKHYFGRCETLLLEGIKRHGRKLELLSRLGYLYYGQGYLEHAEHYATWIIALYPGASEGYLIQARVYGRENELDGSLLMYEEAVSRASDDDGRIPVALELMRTLVRARQWDRFEALASEIRLASHSNKAYRAEYYRIIAWREVLRGKPYEALAALEKAEGAMPLSPNIAMEKGRIYATLDALDRAASEFRKALKVDPNHAGAREALRKLESASGPRNRR
ncbi:MAG: tetratricopeptide repeat protein [Pseudomonadota bacterium]